MQLVTPMKSLPVLALALVAGCAHHSTSRWTSPPPATGLLWRHLPLVAIHDDSLHDVLVAYWGENREAIGIGPSEHVVRWLSRDGHLIRETRWRCKLRVEVRGIRPTRDGILFLGDTHTGEVAAFEGLSSDGTRFHERWRCDGVLSFPYAEWLVSQAPPASPLGVQVALMAPGDKAEAAFDCGGTVVTTDGHTLVCRSGAGELWRRQVPGSVVAASMRRAEVLTNRRNPQALVSLERVNGQVYVLTCDEAVPLATYGYEQRDMARYRAFSVGSLILVSSCPKWDASGLASAQIHTQDGRLVCKLSSFWERDARERDLGWGGGRSATDRVVVGFPGQWVTCHRDGEYKEHIGLPGSPVMMLGNTVYASHNDSVIAVSVGE